MLHCSWWISETTSGSVMEVYHKETGYIRYSIALYVYKFTRGRCIQILCTILTSLPRDQVFLRLFRSLNPLDSFVPHWEYKVCIESEETSTVSWTGPTVKILHIGTGDNAKLPPVFTPIWSPEKIKSIKDSVVQVMVLMHPTIQAYYYPGNGCDATLRNMKFVYPLSLFSLTFYPFIILKPSTLKIMLVFFNISTCFASCAVNNHCTIFLSRKHAKQLSPKCILSVVLQFIEQGFKIEQT